MVAGKNPKKYIYNINIYLRILTDLSPYAPCPISAYIYEGTRIEKDRRGREWAIKRHYVSHHQNELNMTRTDFYLQACIAFAGNNKVLAEKLTAAQCIEIITALAEAVTLKVEESADFDPEFQRGY